MTSLLIVLGFLMLAASTFADDKADMASIESITIQEPQRYLTISLTDKQKEQIKTVKEAYSYDGETQRIILEMAEQELYYENLFNAIEEVIKTYPCAEGILKKHGVELAK